MCFSLDALSCFSKAMHTKEEKGNIKEFVSSLIRGAVPFDSHLKAL